MISATHYTLAAVALLAINVASFVPSLRSNTFRPTSSIRRSSTLEFESVPDQEEIVEEGACVVRAPIQFLGPYPTMALRFPDLATFSQRERNATGISLDFVLDTAANTNTINAQVASELDLDVVGEALPGLGAGGAISGGDTFLLGDCEIDGLAKEDKFTFMTDLTASALPVASPTSAGLLSLAFFNCFPGGIEFNWGSDKTPASVTFHGDEEHLELEGMVRVPITTLPLTLLPTVTLRINGVDIPALFDTGSPITVLNAQAAKAANIKTVEKTKPLEKKSSNPFASMAQNFKAAQEAAQAAARGDILAIAGANGQAIQLLKSTSPVDVQVAVQDDESSSTSMGERHLYVGDLPGLAALDGLGEESPPAAVLGMDVLRQRPRVIFRGQANEVYL